MSQYTYEAREKFDKEMMPFLKEHGMTIGKQAREGNELSNSIISTYQLLYSFFEHCTYAILESQVDEWKKVNLNQINNT